MQIILICATGMAADPINYDMDDKNADVAAVDEGYASITPLMHNLTARDMVEEIKKWRLI